MKRETNPILLRETVKELRKEVNFLKAISFILLILTMICIMFTSISLNELKYDTGLNTTERSIQC